MYSRVYSESDLDNVVLKHRASYIRTEGRMESNLSCVKIIGIPTNFCVTLDNRACDTCIFSEYKVSLDTIHLITVMPPSSSEDDMQILSMFFYASPKSVTVINYNCEQSGAPALVLQTRSPSAVEENNSYGLNRSVGEEWQTLTSDIDSHVLGTAGVTLDNIHLNFPIRFAPLPIASQKSTNRSVPDLVNMTKIDGTRMLSGLLKTRHRGERSRLVGELQLAYLCFAYLGQVRAVEHWYNVIEAVCNAYEAKALFPELVTEFATVLEKQFTVAHKNALDILLTSKVKECLARFVASNWHLPQVVFLTKTIARAMGCYTPPSTSDNSGHVSDDSRGTDDDMC